MDAFQPAIPLIEKLAKSQLSSYQFVIAIQGPFLLALAGAALTLKRPGTRALTLVYGLFSLPAVSSAILAWMHVSARASLEPVVVAITGLVIGAGWSETGRAAQLLSGRMRTRQPDLSRMIFSGVIVAVVLLACGAWDVFVAPSLDAPRLLQRVAIVVMLAQAAVMTLAETRRTTRNTLALRFVALGYAAVVARQLYTMVAEMQAATNAEVHLGTLIAVNESTSVLNGVAFLLAAMLEERTALVEQADQLHATEMQLGAARRLESLGQMAGGIAHDFANMLSVIDGALTGLRMETLPPPLDADLQDADVAVQRAAALTRQLRDYAHSRANARVRFNAEQRLRSMAPVLQRLAGEHVALSFDCDAGVTTDIEMEPSQFDQLPLNLVVNARDAMPGGGTITIRARCDEVPTTRDVVSGRLTPGRYLRLRIEDTGVGIPASSFVQIFEPFYTTKGDRGTGLGLATVFSIVRREFGHLDVTSREGVGTSFDVWLPVVD